MRRGNDNPFLSADIPDYRQKPPITTMVCGTCGCDDFKANPFQKARCKNCSHNHGDGSAEPAASIAASESAPKPKPKTSGDVQSRLARFKTSPGGTGTNVLL